MCQKFKLNSKGFTLMEVMLSVAIFAAVVAGALVYARQIMDDYATVRRESTLRTLNRSLSNKLSCARTFPDPYSLCKPNTFINTRQKNNVLLTANNGSTIADQFKVAAKCRSDGKVNAVEFMYYHPQLKEYMSTSRGIPIGCQAELPCKWNDKKYMERIGGKYYRRQMHYYSSGGYLRRTAEGGGFHGIPTSNSSYWVIYNYISGKGNSYYIRVNRSSCKVTGPITARADPNGCLHKDTRILTEGGELVPIEQLTTGTRIYNATSGEYEDFDHLTQGFEKYLYLIRGEGFSVKTTKTHPIMTPNGFVAAENVRSGDIVIGADGNRVVVKETQKILYEDDVWNIVMSRQNSEEVATFVAEGLIVGDGLEQKRLSQQTKSYGDEN